MKTAPKVILSIGVPIVFFLVFATIISLTSWHSLGDEKFYPVWALYAAVVVAFLYNLWKK